jgi:phytoene dehydrogenase-like protein
MSDVIIIGAGVGGLSCGAKLASKGRKVLIMEQIHHIGGTSHIFVRKREGRYFFPMGPLSFSYPDLVKSMLREMGITEKIHFEKSHFSLITPEINIIYSQPWNDFQKELKKRFPGDSEGIDEFFEELNTVINAVQQVQEWHPEFTLLPEEDNNLKNLSEKHQSDYNIIEKYSEISSKQILDKYIENSTLKKLLGSQGTYEPVMSMVHLAFMWKVMSIEGIWYPSTGIHGINELLSEVIENNSGEILLNTPIEEILIENGKAIGIETQTKEKFYSQWIVSNADYKTTFLNLINPQMVPQKHLDTVRKSAYTSSELCVFLGIDPNKVDLSHLPSQHTFYRDNSVFLEKDIGIEINRDRAIELQKFFRNKEIEICKWSEKEYNSVPEGQASLILRVNMDIQPFLEWRMGIKQRKKGYKEFKTTLANILIQIVENIIPGLSNSINIMETATPLTYLDWGKRYNGSIAGWHRNLEKVKGFDTKILIPTPIKNLLAVGIYSWLEPYLGGYPVSMFSGKLAADFILNQNLI